MQEPRGSTPLESLEKCIQVLHFVFSGLFYSGGPGIKILDSETFLHIFLIC